MSPAAREERSLLALDEGDPARARSEATRSLSVQENWHARAVLAILDKREGNNAQALRHMRSMLDGLCGPIDRAGQDLVLAVTSHGLQLCAARFEERQIKG